jgi:two-component system cell cycle sensor histidine kinase/response regulator CckA
MKWRRTERALTQALLADPCAAVALLDGGGQVVRAGPGLAALGGAAAALAEPVGSEVREAVRLGRMLAVSGDLLTPDGPVPVSVSVVPTGLAAPAAVLRMTDLRPERALQAQLAQAQRLQAVGQLAGGVAHDFNNLLAAISGAAEDLVAQTAEQGREDLEQIKTSAARGAALVRQLLAFGGQQTLQPRPLAVNEAVRNAATLLTRLLGPSITLRLELEEPGRMVTVDPTQLDQVLVNLAVNARDAMKDGGTLTIATGRRLLLQPEADGAQTLPPGRYATIDVRDTGSGIAPEVLPRIFEPFFTTKRGAGGTGLGLSTVHGIVRQSGGYLSVQSQRGQGTCFRITLPRHESGLTGTESVAAPQPPPAPAGNPLLLLVDDEDAVRRLVARALRRGGWDVMEASCGAEALERAGGPYALLVSDVMMPGIDGPALVRAMREHQAGLPAILISGYADAEQRKALAKEDISFLAKPFAMAELVRLAHRVTQMEAAATGPTPQAPTRYLLSENLWRAQARFVTGAPIGLAHPPQALTPHYE